MYSNLCFVIFRARSVDFRGQLRPPWRGESQGNLWPPPWPRGQGQLVWLGRAEMEDPHPFLPAVPERKNSPGCPAHPLWRQRPQLPSWGCCRHEAGPSVPPPAVPSDADRVLPTSTRDAGVMNTFVSVQLGGNSLDHAGIRFNCCGLYLKDKVHFTYRGNYYFFKSISVSWSDKPEWEKTDTFRANMFSLLPLWIVISTELNTVKYNPGP